MDPTLPKAVIFDNDGLLLDTESVWTRAEEDLFERRGDTFTAADKLELVGKSASLAGGILERRLGEPGRGDELMVELDALVVAELERGVEAMVGARELLPALRERGTPIALVSNSPMAFVRPLARAGRLRRRLRPGAERPRSGAAEAGARSLPGGLPPARGRAGPGRRRPRGLAQRRRGSGCRRPHRDRRPLGRGRRPRGSAPLGREPRATRSSRRQLVL